MPRTYYFYILASRSRTLYTGMTNDQRRRVWQHRNGTSAGFTSRYHITRLVYFEWTSNVWSAIAREKEIKRWSRARKVALIEQTNAGWLDLAQDWFPDAGE